MRKYRPSNRMPAQSFFLLLILGIASGIGVGLLLWRVSSWLNFLAIVMVAVAGAIVGQLLVLVVRPGKVRNPLIAGAIGLLSGMLLYGVYQYADYYFTFRDEMRALYIENVGEAPTDAELDQELDAIMQNTVGDTGFVGYLRLTAEVGISLSRSPTSSSSGIELTGTGVLVYWGLEALLAAIIAAMLPFRAAQKPFDEEANEWYGKPTYLASASKQSSKALVNALKAGDFQTAGSLLSTDTIKGQHLEVMTSRSPNSTGSFAQQDIYLNVDMIQRNGRRNTLRDGVISPSELKLLEQTIAQASINPITPSRYRRNSARRSGFI